MSPRRGSGANDLHPALGWAVVVGDAGEVRTVRWRRGEPVAYVLRGRRVGEHGSDGLLGTIRVSARGWADLTEIRLRGEQWCREAAGGQGVQGVQT